jgi:hypothetical protein
MLLSYPRKARTYQNPVGVAKVVLDSGSGRADEAEVRLLFEASGEAVGTDPLELIALPRGGTVLNTIPILLPPRPRVLTASIAFESGPFGPLLAAPKCPINLNKVGSRSARTE